MGVCGSTKIKQEAKIARSNNLDAAPGPAQKGLHCFETLDEQDVIYEGDEVVLVGGFFHGEIAVVRKYDAILGQLDLCVRGMAIARDIGTSKYGGVRAAALPLRKDSKSFTASAESSPSAKSDDANSISREVTITDDPDLEFATSLQLPEEDDDAVNLFFVQDSSSVFSESVYSISADPHLWSGTSRYVSVFSDDEEAPFDCFN